MSKESLSEQLEQRLEDHERHEFAKEVDAEAKDAERADVIAFIERRVAFLNGRGWVGDTFRADECLRMVREVKAGRHVQKPTS